MISFFTYLEIASYGIAIGFASGFIAWGFGFAIYGVIKLFKIAG